MPHRPRYTVCAEYHSAAERDFFQRLDEYRTLAAQIVDDVFVMHYFVAHVDGRSVQAQRLFDDLDGAIDASAKAPRFRQYHYHVRGLR